MTIRGYAQRKDMSVIYVRSAFLNSVLPIATLVNSTDGIHPTPSTGTGISGSGP